MKNKYIGIVFIVLIIAALGVGFIMIGRFDRDVPAFGPEAIGNSVVIENFSFIPSDITVSIGETVTWENKDLTSHTVTSDTGIFDSGLLVRGETFEMTFNEVGMFPYHCIPHPVMTGTVNVVE
jgi:plastocyanin